MKIIVGLGNPGKKYLFTRHNLGFMLIDALASEQDLVFNEKTKRSLVHNSLIHKLEIKGQPVLIVKPQTFMNLSGKAVCDVVSFYKVCLEDLLVVHDDKDLFFGKIKLQKSRGPGGHNGIKSIHEELQTNNYTRLKMGIGSKSFCNLHEGATYYVLSPFEKEEQQKLPFFLEQGLKAVYCFIQHGYEVAANQFNSTK